ncbi:hypothetical protein AK812_SmicGene20904 [Symbiodinium microadriaticum]|uniref:Uncharacterized protein n=1 Tax=Symbiodinium microadriaticum TaxID=2951 RepID=A0A1Q9DNR4_SYMMI|nr:hypothetical protein AK812_SmicGene20904 [Symbiodinium microadriaticum]
MTIIVISNIGFAGISVMSFYLAAVITVVPFFVMTLSVFIFFLLVLLVVDDQVEEVFLVLRLVLAFLIVVILVFVVLHFCLAVTIVQGVERFLTAADRALLTRVVQDAGTAEGDVFAQLVEGLRKLSGCELNEVLSASRFVPHPLNALGLHLLRSLLAERMADARAIERGSAGNVTVQETPDPQSQLHIDTFAPIVKVWVFQDPPGVSLDEGPLLFSQRSHRNSEAKLRWMHAYAQEPASEARAEPSFRLRGCAAAAKAAADFVQAVEGHLILEAAAAAQPVLPLPGVRRTLVLADTSALHARGTGVPGRVRCSWRQAGDNDGGLKRLNPYRWTEAKQEL